MPPAVGRVGECAALGVLRKTIQSSRYSSKSINKVTMPSCIEVERKFLPTMALKELLYGSCKPEPHLGFGNGRSSFGKPAIKFSRLPDRLMRDTYYDTIDRNLELNGIWVRQRGTSIINAEASVSQNKNWVPQSWEAKARLSGDYADSQFHEVYEEAEVRKLVAKHSSSERLESLMATADLLTHRKTWIIQETGPRKPLEKAEIRIDLDEVTSPELDALAAFNHEIGELEMTQEVCTEGHGEEDERTKRQAGASMKKWLDDFIARYPSLFPCLPKPKGKLSAYFEWQASLEKATTGRVNET